MIRLSREIRFPLVTRDSGQQSNAGNSWAGKPATNRLVPRLRLRCSIEGQPNATTGYLCNIKLLDELLDSAVAANVDALLPSADRPESASAEKFLTIVANECLNRWQRDARIVNLALELTPFLRYQIDMSESNMAATTPRLSMTEQFEFSAAHRLYCPEMSDTRNREIFGKCSNPEGHGHNYVVDVTVSNQVAADAGQIIDLATLESIVNAKVIDVLDHQHLNRDISYFAEINPTVENIAIAIYNWLDGQFGEAQLDCIRVYETPKTWAEYRGASA